MHQRIISFASPGDIVPTATFAGVHRTPLLANALLFDTVPKASSVPPPPLRGTSPERGRFIYGRFLNRPYRANR